MQLKAVVLPAPLGPMRPTISNSPTSSVTPDSACRPPKRMATSCVSRTDTEALRACSPTRAEDERLALQPPADRCRDGTQPVGLEDQREDGEHAARRLHDEAGVVDDEPVVQVLGQIGEVLLAEDVNESEEHDAAAPSEPAHHG